MFERFLAWAGDLLHGDLGVPALQRARGRGHRLAGGQLARPHGVAWVASGVLGFVLGVAAALREGRLLDRFVRGYCFVLAASPTFWVGLLLLMVFSVWLGWFPLGFSVPVGVAARRCHLRRCAASHGAAGHHAIGGGGGQRGAAHPAKASDVLNTTTVRIRPGRGLTRREALIRHGLRNLALPAITLQFSQIAEIFGGSVLVEEVFSYPGLGQAAVTAGLGGDVALLAGIALVSAALVFTGNLAANLIYGLVDPRMRPVRRQKEVADD